MNSFFKFTIFFALAFFPLVSSAQTVSLTTAKSVYNVGEAFLVTVSVNTQGASINTLSGEVVVPSDFAVREVRSGNSIISLWVDQPKVNPVAGTILFTGGIPGGYNGSSGTIFSFVVHSKKEGVVATTLKNLKILLNDGQGTEVSQVATPLLSLRFENAPAVEKVVSPADPLKNEEKTTQEPKIEVLVPDLVPPEDFIPIITRHPSVEDNAYFISFFAVDKDSGIEGYEERELARYLGPFSQIFSHDWLEARSPHVLKIQIWPTRVEIRASDKDGNVIVGFAHKPAHPILVFIFIIIIVVLTALLTRTTLVRAWRRNRAKIKRQ